MDAQSVPPTEFIKMSNKWQIALRVLGAVIRILEKALGGK